MPYKNFDRYSQLKKSDGTTEMMPFVKLPVNSSDKYIYWNSEYDRLDKISLKYYENPLYDFFILYANPEYISEFDIPDGTLIRIPFPLLKVKADYESILSTFNK